MDIEKKALELAVEAAGRRMQDYNIMSEENVLRQSIKAHARAIEQHEAFRREVSDVISELSSEYESMGSYYADKLRRFIIPQPDPLDGVIYGAGFGRGNAELLREAADRLGYRLELVKKEPSQ